MKCLEKWSTQVELQAAAPLAQIPIYVLTKGSAERKWIMYKPQSITSLKFPDEELNFCLIIFLGHPELCHINGNHYDCVVTAEDQCSTTPPVLQECHKYVSKVL